MHEHTLKTGDLVKFRTGGPPTVGASTVREIFADGRVTLVWIGRDGKKWNGSCYVAELEWVSDPMLPHISL
jgi:uncharacterized protein YodC (DUF2158 family)